jgi:uncharacterized protein YdeI (YjbR/CyaY-like superfamily)
MSSSPVKSFTALLEPLENGLGWVIARIPFDVAKTWPVRNRLRVRGEIEGFAFRTSLMAFRSGGGHFLLVNREMQAGAKVRVGAKVRIKLEPDMEERADLIPAELAAALKGDRRLRGWFDRLSPSMRREIGKWVSEPKSAASRRQRAEKMAERLLLTMEGETELPPILHSAFLGQPLARKGWEAMTPTQRRNHLLGIFYNGTIEARERRVAKAVEDALLVAGKGAPKAE